MTALSTIWLTSFIFLAIGCQNSKKVNAKSPLIEKDITKKLERENSLFAFVGEKIEVRYDKERSGEMDVAFQARYKILQRVYGHYDKDTIEFIAFDHYGTPRFSEYQNVLLFVSRWDSGFYHEKYMYNDVYSTKDGKWAGSYNTADYRHEGNEGTSIKPERIAFEQEVSYPIRPEVDSSWFPEPYYQIVNGKAVTIYGNYIEDLFLLKKNGVLMARELFGDTVRQSKPHPPLREIILEELPEEDTPTKTKIKKK